MKTWIIQKLTSRKFWLGITGVVSGLIMMFGVADTDVETITGALLAIGSAVGYMITEGMVDAKSLGQIFENGEIIYEEMTDKKDGEE